MDMQSATRVVGIGGKLARIAALLCFVLASGILAASHSGPTKANMEIGSPSLNTLNFAAR